MKALFFTLALILFGFVSCKKEKHEPGNIKDYQDIQLDSTLNNPDASNDSLVGNYSGLNYVPLEIIEGSADESEDNHLAEIDPRSNTPLENGSYDSIMLVNYTELVNQFNGYVYTLSDNELIGDTIISIFELQIPSSSDIVFLIDKSMSMQDDIDNVRLALDSIIDHIPDNANLAAAAYSDNNCEIDWYSSMPGLTTDYTEVKSFINSIIVGGGCSDGESVYDAIYQTLNKYNWNVLTSNAIIVIGDEPPLKGDLTHHSIEEIKALCQTIGIELSLFPILTK